VRTYNFTGPYVWLFPTRTNASAENTVVQHNYCQNTQPTQDCPSPERKLNNKKQDNRITAKENSISKSQNSATKKNYTTA
jgi:hypothetical protein